ncbi:HAMP domain-containing histidine kinase [Sulfurimonas sp. SAG-AH-194-C20]|nr:HAMP domain-containing sensor histidine kinase [Sulfurimonas sp. SAG-AH-194-C20]MDF1878106.1 HAMP domain-containing histidine kinase [Sulfurimonas sp. SAG-AH-194-C20]
MNDLEKHSFYSFLGIYLVSSLFFVLLSSFWYYSSLKSSLESETYYKLTHLADTISGRIINAQMKGISLELPSEEGYGYMLVPIHEKKAYKLGYYEKNGYKVLVSASPQEHLNIAYVVVKTQHYFKELKKLKSDVATRAGLVFVAIFLISFILAKLFMKPVHKRIEQIEEFIQDVSHELNTPITALKMSASRAIKKEVYDKKILTNISISTKQLETIYNSLTYLNFSDKQEKSTDVGLDEIVKRVVKYYWELSDAKGIKVEVEIQRASLNIIESRAELLISNLLSNAIKYSMPESTIHISLKEGLFIIKDEGVGIAKDKLDAIFELYSRDSQIAGGFGVGLSIVKQICDTYKIKVEVSSVLGEGSEFRLLF